MPRPLSGRHDRRRATGRTTLHADGSDGEHWSVSAKRALRSAHAVAWLAVAGSTLVIAWTSGALTPPVGLLAAALVGASAASTRPRGPLAPIAAVVGAIAAVVGVALGIRFFDAGVPSLRASVALIDLPAGLVLIAAGLVDGARGLPPLRKIATTASLVAAVVFAGYAVAPGVLATNIPRVASGEGTPADRDIPFEVVSMRSADGLSLAGWYVPSRNGAAVVLRHGSHSSKTRELDHLEPLVAAGFGVLVPDARGCGDSEGMAMDFGWYGEDDLRAAVDFLASWRDVDATRIGIVGISLGGMEAIGAAGVDARVAGVVAEGAVRRSARDLEWLPELDGIGGALQLAMNRTQTAVTEALARRAAPPSLADSVSAARSTRFLLMTADLRDEVAAATRMRERAPGRVEVLTIAGAGHAAGFAVAPALWSRAVVAFLEDALAKKSLLPRDTEVRLRRGIL
jgi:dienelactone hydrolase